MQSHRPDKDYLIELKKLLESTASDLSSISITKINPIAYFKLQSFISTLEQNITKLDDILKHETISNKDQFCLLEFLSYLIEMQKNLHVTAQVVLDALKVIPKFTTLLAEMKCNDSYFSNISSYLSFPLECYWGAVKVKKEKNEIAKRNFEKRYLPSLLIVRSIVSTMLQEIRADTVETKRKITEMIKSIEFNLRGYSVECKEVYSREQQIEKLKIEHKNAVTFNQVRDYEHSTNCYDLGYKCNSNCNHSEVKYTCIAVPLIETRLHIDSQITLLQNEINELLMASPETKKLVEDYQARIQLREETLDALRKKESNLFAFSMLLEDIYNKSHISENEIDKNWSEAKSYLTNCYKKKSNQAEYLEFWFYLLFKFCRDYNEKHFDYPQQLHTVLKQFKYADPCILKLFRKTWIKTHQETEQKYVSLAVCGLFTNQLQLPIDISNLIATHVPRKDGGRVAQVCTSTHPNHPKN